MSADGHQWRAQGIYELMIGGVSGKHERSDQAVKRTTKENLRIACHGLHNGYNMPLDRPKAKHIVENDSFVLKSLCETKTSIPFDTLIRTHEV